MGGKRKRKLVAPGSSINKTPRPLPTQYDFVSKATTSNLPPVVLPNNNPAPSVLHILNLGGDNLNLLHLKNLNRLHFMELHRLTVLKHKTLMETQKILLSSKGVHNGPVSQTRAWYNMLLQNAGLAMVYFLGNFISWRMMALLGALPCVIQGIGLFFIPESPRWLAKVGADKELENSLLRLRGKDVDISLEASEIQVMTKMLESDSKSSFSDLFQRKYRRTLVVQCFSVAIGSTLLAIFMVPKAMIGEIFVDKWGRRPLLLTSACGMSITCMFIGLASTLQKMHLLSEVTPVLTFICVTLYLAAYAIGVGGLPWVIMSEIFPMNMKVTAGSLVTLASWSSSSIVTYAFNFLFEWSTRGLIDINYEHFTYSGLSQEQQGAALVFIWLLVPETKGLSLEEIQTSLIREPDEIYHM
ncbi:hypothetical protein F2Q68_00012133 [Brassica cretica]|uniref:Major facilitator superfamily (MFS) profile domain-containing protein n=2 Tax=Brassica cretica TaxID=69181 RepID=A0A8S9KS09_BRACR|nr:hypothetical protein F2Q68_00012133 [Brassica cretica]